MRELESREDEIRRGDALRVEKDVIPVAASKPQYLVDEKGKKKAVLLSIKEYDELMQRIEDLEDALELDEAVKTAEGFRDYQEIRKELKEWL